MAINHLSLNPSVQFEAAPWMNLRINRIDETLVQCNHVVEELEMSAENKK